VVTRRRKEPIAVAVEFDVHHCALVRMSETQHTAGLAGGDRAGLTASLTLVLVLEASRQKQENNRAEKILK